MNEPQLQRALDETTDFLQRQELFKQLWKLRRQSPAEGGGGLLQTREPSQPEQDPALKQPQEMIA